MAELAGCGIEDYELVDKFRTYDDYLDSFVTDSDVFYLEDRQTARRVVELGFIHGNGDLLKRGEYLAKQRAIADYRQSLLYKGPKPLLGAGKDVKGSPLLKAIVEREQALRDGSLSTIIFIRDYNSRGQEVSGYIDLGHRLAMDEVGMEAVLQLAKRFLPQSNDLSFYNWDTHAVTSSPTANFEVLVDAQKGLLFRNTRDRKVVAVDPLAPSPGDYSTRTELDTEEYVQALVFDHVVGKRS